MARAGIPDPERVASGVDVIGDIAIVRLEDLGGPEKKKVAGAILTEMSNVKSVYEQKGGIEGEYRLRKLRHLAGRVGTLTTHKENGCAFKVDVAKCYFSPRLATERLRVAVQASREDLVLNMFAGVGPFSIEVAKKSGAKVTSCEVNSYACELHEANDQMNKVGPLVTVIRGDAAELPRLGLKFDRILMPHPSQADKFLPTALAVAEKGAVIHYYRHVLGIDEEEATKKMEAELARIVPRAAHSTRRVRLVGPRWIEMEADIVLP